MAKQFQVRKPIASEEVVKEKVKEAAPVRADDWQERLKATITQDNFETWKQLAIQGYSAANAPPEWLAMYNIGMKLLTYDGFTLALPVGAQVWQIKLTSDYVLNKLATQYGGNRYILVETRNIIVDKGFDTPDKNADRIVLQILCMKYGRQYLELKLRELFGVEQPDYTEIDTAFREELVAELGLSTTDADEIVNRIKTAAFNGAQYIYNKVTGQP